METAQKWKEGNERRRHEGSKEGRKGKNNSKWMLGRKKTKEGDRKGTREEVGHMGTKGMEKGQRRQEKG